MFKALFALVSLTSISPTAPARSVDEARVPQPLTATVAAAAGGTIVQTGGVFTGVFEGSRSFDLPVTIDGFAPGLGKLQRVEIDLDVRMSGEYTILPTPVPPNGIVVSHSTTTLVLDGTSLGSVSLDFAPIPWIYPVSFPISVLWAKDGSDASAFSDKATLRAFTGNKPIKLAAEIDVTAKVSPIGWADHFQGVLATWEIRYVYD